MVVTRGPSSELGLALYKPFPADQDEYPYIKLHALVTGSGTYLQAERMSYHDVLVELKKQGGQPSGAGAEILVDG